MPKSNIQVFSEFNDFHQMANGAVRSHHDNIHVFRFEDVNDDAVQHTPLFKTNFYQIGLFREVKIDVSYFSNVQTIRHKNVIVLFKPGQVVAFSKADPAASGYAVMFKELFADFRLENANTLRDFSILNPMADSVFFADEQTFGELVDIAARMYHEYNQLLRVNNERILRLYCQILIEKIERIHTQPVNQELPSVHLKTWQNFKRLVFQQIHTTKSVSDYAAMLATTEKTLINHVKLVTDATPKEFINQVIVEESKAMLLENLTVYQIAAHFNFNDQAHFSNFFKKMTGLAPREFRKHKES